MAAFAPSRWLSVRPLSAHVPERLHGSPHNQPATTTSRPAPGKNENLGPPNHSSVTQKGPGIIVAAGASILAYSTDLERAGFSRWHLRTSPELDGNRPTDTFMV